MYFILAYSNETAHLSMQENTEASFSSLNISKAVEEEHGGLSEMFRSQKAIADYENLCDNKVRVSLSLIAGVCIGCQNI